MTRDLDKGIASSIAIAGDADRRSLLVAIGAAFVTTSLAMAVSGRTSPVAAQGAAAPRTQPKPGAAPAAKAPVAAHADLIAAAKRCGSVGETCLKHCVRLTKAGDKSLAECLKTVSAMLPVCAAVGRLAAQDAARLKDLAKVCIDVCGDCETACRKHEFHHVECKNCAEACAAMVKACKSAIGA